MNKKWLFIGVAAAIVAVIVLSVILIVSAVDGNTVDRIAVSKSPDKTEYGLNESANYEGIWLQVFKKNGSFEVVRDTSLMTFSGFDSSKENDSLSIKVEYEGAAASFKVSIVDNTPVPTPRISRIYLETLPTKLTYTMSDILDVSGGVVVREYTDGSKIRVNLMAKDVTGFLAAKDAGVGEHDLTVTYEERDTGIIKTTTYKITITE